MADTLIAGRYRLDTLLGQGGMSEVWRATDLELDREVALKLLAPDEDNARFEREARAVAALGHPNVTQLYDYGEADGRPFMVLEYLSGGTLEDRLRANGRLADADTQRVSTEIAAGLTHAHARGVVHRDLKPSNVLFDGEGRAKLADFGIARMTAGDGTLTEAGTVLGTAAYISPEQASGRPATATSDVYSFGVMLFRMLTGRLPFESDDPFELVVRHRDVLPPLVTDVRPDAPRELAATADASLAKDPAQRPPDGSALLAALGGAVTATPPFAAGEDATRVMPAAVPPPRRRRRIGPVLAVLLLLLLALAGGALAYVVTRPDDAPAVTLPTTTPTHSHSTPATTTAPTTTRAPATTTQPHTTPRPPAPTRPAPLPPPPPPPPTTTVVTTVAPPPPTTTDEPATTDTTTTDTTTTSPSP